MAMVSLQATSHAEGLSSSLATLVTNFPPDLTIVSSEGFLLPAHSFILSLHSPSLLRPLLASLPPSPYLSLPICAQPISALLQLLATGSSAHSESFDPLQVVEAAELLGVEVEEIIIGDKQKQVVKDRDIQAEAVHFNVGLQGGAQMVVEGNRNLQGRAQMVVVGKKVDGPGDGDVEAVDMEADVKEETFGDAKTDASCEMDPVVGNKQKTERKLKDCKRLLKTKDGKSAENEVGFNCNRCDFKTFVKSHLKRHIEAKHTGIRYDCDECEFQTAYSKDVRRHKMSIHHNGIKPFKCPECEYKSATQEYLSSHMKSHIRQACETDQ